MFATTFRDAARSCNTNNGAKPVAGKMKKAAKRGLSRIIGNASMAYAPLRLLLLALVFAVAVFPFGFTSAASTVKLLGASNLCRPSSLTGTKAVG